MTRSCGRVIKDMDVFGHPVILNFNKNGPTHNTLLGGCCTILFYIIIVMLVLK